MFSIYMKWFCPVCFVDSFTAAQHRWGLFFCPPPAPLKPISVSKLLNQNVSLNVNCLQNGRRNQPGVCMKTQALWLMLLPLPALMALIFSSAERSQGLRCQMLFCSPPFTGFTRERALHVVLYARGLMDSFIWGSDTAKRVWSSILFPPSIAVKY